MPKNTTTPYNIGEEATSIVEIIRQLGYKYSTWNVFEDFLQMSAISISNSVDWAHKEEREALYMETVAKYSKEEVNKFPQMFAHLVDALDDIVTNDGMDDILGKIFHSLELHNRYKGQFYYTISCVRIYG